MANFLKCATGTEFCKSWRLFSRLDRPGLVAMRLVRRTTGLDLFLLEDEMEGVEDVAELMAFDTCQDSDLDDGIDRVLEAPGCLFLSFLQLNWDALEDPGLWKGYGLARPTRSAVLAAIKASLHKARLSGLLSSHPITCHLLFGMGETDIIVVGKTHNRELLDTFLLTLTQLGTDCLAREMGAAAEAVHDWSPVIQASTTELCIDWDLYQEALTAAQTGQGLEKVLHSVQQAHQGSIHAEILLKRTRGCLADVRNKVRHAIPAEWEDRAVLGEADIILQHGGGQSSSSLSDLVVLFAKLDVCAEMDEAFPQRRAIILSFDRPCGQGDQEQELPPRAQVLYSGISEHPQRPHQHTRTLNGSDTAECLSYLKSIHDLRFRDEFRIIERMAERCMLLHRNSELPYAARKLASLVMKRISRAIRRLNTCSSGREEARDSALRELRFGLVNTGVHMDRTLHFLTRGTIPLLRGSTVHGRVTDHFSSEAFLASALATPAVSVASRLLWTLRRLEIPGQPPDSWFSLLEILEDMTEPIIYSSHDLDFRLVPPLGIIHVPRWVLWYPASSSFILHELGHAVFNEVGMEALMLHAAQQRRANPWCSTLCENGLHRHRLWVDTSDSNAWREWAGEQHEIAAELFNRLFAYDRSDQQRYLFDQIEHLYSISQRSTAMERRSLITRSLSVHLAHSLLMSITHEQAGHDPASGTFDDLMRRELGSFVVLLYQWLADPPPPINGLPPAEARLLKNDLRTVMSEMQILLREWDGIHDYDNAIGRAVHRGVFMAFVATSLYQAQSAGIVVGSSAQVAMLAWHAIILASSSVEKSMAERSGIEQGILRDLIAGMVPHEPTCAPERLPRRLFAMLRQAKKSLLIEHRFALVCCLADIARVTFPTRAGLVASKVNDTREGWGKRDRCLRSDDTEVQAGSVAAAGS